jgi:hypothetical protein
MGKGYKKAGIKVYQYPDGKIKVSFEDDRRRLIKIEGNDYKITKH